MRIILFRGKRVDNGDWVYGFYWYDQLGNRHMIQSVEFLKNGWNQKVISETVGQYTGVKDINGKDVYELDKVKMHYFFRNAYAPDYGVFEDEGEIVGIVGIDEFGVYTECNGEKWYWFTYVGDPETQLEVIGTIFD